MSKKRPINAKQSTRKYKPRSKKRRSIDILQYSLKINLII